MCFKTVVMKCIYYISVYFKVVENSFKMFFEDILLIECFIKTKYKIITINDD